MFTVICCGPFGISPKPESFFGSALSDLDDPSLRAERDDRTLRGCTSTAGA
jgi:hypothetical protein